MAAAAMLALDRPDTIVASDLRRAADTAGALAGETGLPIHFDARLRERFYGDWQGLTGDEISAVYPDDYVRWRRGEDIGAHGIESSDDFTKRVAAGVQDAVARADGGTLVLVLHLGTAKIVLGELLGWPSTTLRQLVGLHNCHWTEMRHDALRGWQIHAYNVG
jgi:probable phosphoglycerate mutase